MRSRTVAIHSLTISFVVVVIPCGKGWALWTRKQQSVIYECGGGDEDMERRRIMKLIYLEKTINKCHYLCGAFSQIFF
jgi:hypothetical protein